MSKFPLLITFPTGYCTISYVSKWPYLFTYEICKLRGSYSYDQCVCYSIMAISNENQEQTNNFLWSLQ